MMHLEMLINGLFNELINQVFVSPSTDATVNGQPSTVISVFTLVVSLAVFFLLKRLSNVFLIVFSAFFCVFSSVFPELAGAVFLSCDGFTQVFLKVLDRLVFYSNCGILRFIGFGIRPPSSRCQLPVWQKPPPVVLLQRTNRYLLNSTPFLFAGC